MLTKEEVIELLHPIKDPFLHTAFKDTGAIVNVSIREEKKHVSVKLAIGKPNTAEQMELQQEIVGLLKRNGVSTVGLRFEQLPEDIIKKYQPASEKDDSLLGEDKQPHYIAIASGKGGVGKSTATVNLAMSLMRIGKKVGIIDADIYGFSIPELMGIVNKPEVRGEKVIPIERFGVKVMSMGFFVEDNSPIIWRGPMLGKMLNNFFKEVEWGDLDYLLLDLPPGTGDIAMDVHDLLPSCDEVIVTTPHRPSAFVAARAGRMAQKMDYNILGVIENMAYYQSEETGKKEYVFGKDGGDKVANDLGTKVIGRLALKQPYEQDINDDDFAPGVFQEDHPNVQEYHRIASKLIATLEEKSEAKS